jgi:hypothetical protein
MTVIQLILVFYLQRLIMKYNRHLDQSLEAIIQELTDAEFEQVSGGIAIGEPNGSNPFPPIDTSWISDLAEQLKSFPGISFGSDAGEVQGPASKPILVD